jgi:hypothetical protein
MEDKKQQIGFIYSISDDECNDFDVEGEFNQEWLDAYIAKHGPTDLFEALARMTAQVVTSLDKTLMKFIDVPQSENP